MIPKRWVFVTVATIAIGLFVFFTHSLPAVNEIMSDPSFFDDQEPVGGSPLDIWPALVAASGLVGAVYVVLEANRRIRDRRGQTGTATPRRRDTFKEP